MEREEIVKDSQLEMYPFYKLYVSYYLYRCIRPTNCSIYLFHLQKCIGPTNHIDVSVLLTVVYI